MVHVCGTVMVHVCGTVMVHVCGPVMVHVCGTVTVHAWDTVMVHVCGTVMVHVCGTVMVHVCIYMISLLHGFVRIYANMVHTETNHMKRSMQIPWPNHQLSLYATTLVMKGLSYKTAYESVHVILPSINDIIPSLDIDDCSYCTTSV